MEIHTDRNFIFYAIVDRKTQMFVKKTARDLKLTPKIGQARIFSNYKVAKLGYNKRYYPNADLYIQPLYANFVPCEEMEQ